MDREKVKVVDTDRLKAAFRQHFPLNYKILAQLVDDLTVPRVLTVEEISALSDGSVIWEEFYNADTKSTDQVIFPCMKYGKELITYDGGVFIGDDMGTDADGDRWRWWTSLPDDDERKEVPWA